MTKARLQRMLVATSVCAVGFVGIGATAASAGEITGNGTYKEVKGKSECAYSGQNDGFHDPEAVDFPGDELQRVQSFGQLIRMGVPVPPGLPGMACNPTAAPPPEPVE